jgi:hypothetical protein
MKRFITAAVLLAAIAGVNFSQENENTDSSSEYEQNESTDSSPENEQKGNTNLYTFFLNIVHEQFRVPLIGFINIAGGSHSSPQIGFVNWNQNDFKTVQMGFVNTAGGNIAGTQIGFVNTALKSFTGLQLGFVNTSMEKLSGAQISFANITRQMRGFQFGFINYADSIESGMPVGLISIVKKNGYRAIEIGVSERAPINFAFKIGVDAFYTTINVSYNPHEAGIREELFVGAGFGSIAPVTKRFFFNPEIMAMNGIDEYSFEYIHFVPYFGFNLTSHLNILIGPSLSWAWSDGKIREPFIAIMEHKINESNSLVFGGKIALRFHW